MHGAEFVSPEQVIFGWNPMIVASVILIISYIILFTEKINQLGYEYLYAPFDLNGKGSKIAFIKDPDGYEIELIEKVQW